MMGSASRCIECSADIAPGLMACPGCARLVHGVELESLAKAATAAEKEGSMTEALASWRCAIALLPPGTTQYKSIDSRMRALSAAIDRRGAIPAGVGENGNGKNGTSGKKAGAAAGVGAVGLALVKSKALLVLLLGNGKLLLLGLLKVPTLLSMLIYVPWLSSRGLGFGIGLVASIYVHEIGHVAALKRYGIDSTAPMFVPGFGAFVRMKQYPTDAHEESRTGLAGPLWGLVAALVAAGIGAIFKSSTALTVASVGATINLFNLIPFWQLDGARGLRALSRNQRIVVAVVGIVTALGAHQVMPAVVGVLALVRAFAPDAREAEPAGDRSMLLLFVSLIVAHSLLALLPITV